MPTFDKYPNFNTLPPEIADQLKLAWDAIFALSSKLDGISVPDISALTSSLTREVQQRQLTDRNLSTLQADFDLVDILTTKGDILTRAANAYTRLGVGSDYQTLRALASAASGLAWDDAPFIRSTRTTDFVAPNGGSRLPFTTDLENTVGATLHDTAGLNTRFNFGNARPGVWLALSSVRWVTSTAGTFRQASHIMNNTTFTGSGPYSPLSATIPDDILCFTLRRFVAGDYLEVGLGQDTGGNLNVSFGSEFSPIFSAIWLRP